MASLLSEWRQERAFRVVFAISRIGLVLICIASLVDVVFQMPTVTLLGDFFLLGGCSLAIFWSRPHAPKFHPYAWIPLYVSLWLGFSSSLATTGGLTSPFSGSYWALLFLAGLLIQVRFHPMTVTAFILANLSCWVVAEHFFPDAFGNNDPPWTFTLVTNLLTLGALFIFVSEFLKTEQDLGEELLRRYRELTRTREDLNRQEEANATKSTFLANISHELRTPLGAILGYAELMQASDIHPLQKEKFAETIHRNGMQLSRLVDDLLDLSKAEAGKIEVDNSEFKLKSAVNEVTDLLSLSAQQKNIALETVFQEPLPETMFSDPLRFKQILRNLIGNALKFTSEGHVRIIVSLCPSEERGNCLQIEIEDTGCGLTAEEQKKIFRAFTQGDPSVSRKFGGSGLGLSLSRHLAKLLGGDLRLAWSQKDFGSCFVLQMPLLEKSGNLHLDPTSSFFARV